MQGHRVLQRASGSTILLDDTFVMNWKGGGNDAQSTNPEVRMIDVGDSVQ